MAENSIIPKEVKEMMMTSSEFKSLISQGVWKRKMVESVQVMTVLNENKGMVLFPNLKGKVDTNYAFFSKDPQFHEWCFDYFNHTWDRAGTYDIYKLCQLTNATAGIRDLQEQARLSHSGPWLRPVAQSIAVYPSSSSAISQDCRQSCLAYGL